MDRFELWKGCPKARLFRAPFWCAFCAKRVPEGVLLGTFWGAFPVRFSVRFFGGCLAPEGATPVKGGVGMRAQEGVGGGINSSP